MERAPLQSRAVASAGYDVETGTLEIEFSSGRVYRFQKVPGGVYDWLLRVPNKGVYIAKSITGRYAYEDITHPCTGDQSIDLAALLEASLAGRADE